MSNMQSLAPAQKLAATNKAHFPNESAEYRRARNALLGEEIELRRQIERVASNVVLCPWAVRFRTISSLSPRPACPPLQPFRR